MNTLDKFETDLERKGSGMAPNGATYTMSECNGNPSVIRTHNGEREEIVGFNNEVFDNLGHARHWAISDGRHEYKPFHPLHERIKLA